MRDVFEERTDRVEKFSVSVSTLQAGLTSELRMNLNRGVEKAKEFAGTEIEKIKTQFIELFVELDNQIAKKYEELEACANDQKTKDAELEKNKKLLAWIEDCKAQMESMLEI